KKAAASGCEAAAGLTGAGRLFALALPLAVLLLLLLAVAILVAAALPAAALVLLTLAAAHAALAPLARAVLAALLSLIVVSHLSISSFVFTRPARNGRDGAQNAGRAAAVPGRSG